MAEVKCRYFNGYKPCRLNSTCNSTCPHRDLIQNSVLIIHLGALGAVLRATSILPGVKRKFPKSRIVWITDKPADQLLKHNPLIDQILTTDIIGLLELSSLEFEAAFVIDKSQKASGILKHTKADLVFGFTTDAQTGASLPATSAAEELWEIGLSNHKKFFENQKPETQLLVEALELGAYQKDEYILKLNDAEIKESLQRQNNWSKNQTKTIIGINTGSSNVIAYKKLSIAKHRELIKKLSELENISIVLLGGPEDTLRNERIAYGLPVYQSPTNRGLRDGIVSMNAVDIVITGDSLGMHMAIALKKWTMAWFGPTCAHEIELYGRGEKLLAPVACGPCWKRLCTKEIMCYDLVSVDHILEAIKRGLDWHNTSSLSKQPLLEICS